MTLSHPRASIVARHSTMRASRALAPPSGVAGASPRRAATLRRASRVARRASRRGVVAPRASSRDDGDASPVGVVVAEDDPDPEPRRAPTPSRDALATPPAPVAPPRDDDDDDADAPAPPPPTNVAARVVATASALAVAFAVGTIDPASSPLPPSPSRLLAPAPPPPASSNREPRRLTTGFPAGATCGDFSEARTRVAREVLTCNQDNWRSNCLAHYAADVTYVDGPGLVRVSGADQMRTYLANQFDFSRQYLTVAEETCAADTYVAQWVLDMDLGTGELRDMPGVSVLKFRPEKTKSPGAEATPTPRRDERGAEQLEGGGGDDDQGRAAAAAAAGGASAGREGEGEDEGEEEEEANVVSYHRDYLPDGKIWERAPIVGPLVKFQREAYVGCMLSPRGCAELLGAPK